MGDEGAWILWLTAGVAIAVFILLGLVQKAKSKRQLSEEGPERVAATWSRVAAVLNGTVRWPVQDPDSVALLAPVFL